MVALFLYFHLSPRTTPHIEFGTIHSSASGNLVPILSVHSMIYLCRGPATPTITIRTATCIHSADTPRPLPYLSAPQILSWLHGQSGGHRALRKRRILHVGIPARRPGTCCARWSPSACDAFGRSRHPS